MGTVRGTHDVSSTAGREADSHNDSASIGFTQFSPSQLPTLLCGVEETDGGVLSGRVLSELRRLLCCPMCRRALVHNPAVVDTCGHAFCYDCINLGLENGCLPVATEEEEEQQQEQMEGKAEAHVEELHCNAESEGNAVGDRSSRKRCAAAAVGVAGGRQQQRRRQQRRRKLKFTCPVCLGPAHKWNLVRVPLFREVVVEAMKHATLAEALRDDGGVSRVKEEVTVIREVSLAPTAATAIDTSPLPPPPQPLQGEEEAALTAMGDAEVVANVEVEKDDGEPSTPQPSPSSSASSPVCTPDLLTAPPSLEIAPVPRPLANIHPLLTGTLARDVPVGTAPSGTNIAGVTTLFGTGQATELGSQGEMIVGGTWGDADDSNVGVVYSQPQQPSRQEDPGALPSHVFEVDPSVPCTAEVSDVLTAAVRLFGGAIFDERGAGGSSLLSNSQQGEKELQDQQPAICVVMHPLQPSSPIEAAPVNRNALAWRELHCAAAPLASTHCLVVVSPSHLASVPCRDETEKEERIVTVMTPSIGSALITGAAVISWRWLQDSVKAKELLPVAPYTASGSLYARWHAIELHGEEPAAGQWMSTGYGFLLLPDTLLHVLHSGGNTKDLVAGNSSPNITTASATGMATGGYANSCWRRLVLLGGGVWIQLAEGCLEALVAYALSDERTEAEERGTQQESVMSPLSVDDKDTDHSEDVLWRALQGVVGPQHCLWQAECSPEKQAASESAVHRVVVMRGAVPLVGRRAELERRLARLVRGLAVLFSLSPAAADERVESSVWSWGPSLNESVSCLRFARGDTANAGDATLQVEVRSTTWLLRNLAERRQSAGVQRRWSAAVAAATLGSGESGDGSSGCSGTEVSRAVFQNPLYDC
ncbi:conserved RING finger protein [Trypanosoma grayi]|uniref:conserved RING finger protein n=1 Tax=Trypanosoma grayi TaxID=71804 RepID=UPI0004F461E1|nr:conserved RING finger protein [Trypanosoma grayi]KEG10177.1 conserved RING finger protein [Trypanosoma grayi]